MKNATRQRGVVRVRRREFFGIGARTAAALVALPAASLLLPGCGEGETPGEVPPQRSPATPSPAAAPLTPAPTARAQDALVTEIAALAPVVSALRYVHETPQPDRRCSNCQLYTAGADGRGRCQLFTQGLVKESGWCASWVPRTS